MEYFKKHKVGYLNIRLNIIQNKKLNDDSQRSSWQNYLKINKGYYEYSVAISTKEIKDNYAKVNNIPSLTTDLWKHGTAGIYDVVDDIKPTHWYGQQHPFEFEFVVNGQGAESQVQKVFNNLIILSTKAEPESFHFDIVGEGYTFSKDKLNMYYRQELTKKFFNQLGSDITYNKKFEKLKYNKNKKSNLFDLYYNRIDTINELYDTYQMQNSATKDYQNLSGTELYWDKDLNEFRVITHVKNMPFNNIDSNNRLIGRLRGNSQYKEDRWDIQIPSINFRQKNEVTDNVSVVLGNNIPQDIDPIPEIVKNYTLDKITTWSDRQETKLRDKYIKIRVRYSGKDLAIITAIHTLYILSYA